MLTGFLASIERSLPCSAGTADLPDDCFFHIFFLLHLISQWKHYIKRLILGQPVSAVFLNFFVLYFGHILGLDNAIMETSWGGCHSDNYQSSARSYPSRSKSFISRIVGMSTTKSSIVILGSSGLVIMRDSILL